MPSLRQVLCVISDSLHKLPSLHSERYVPEVVRTRIAAKIGAILLTAALLSVVIAGGMYVGMSTDLNGKIRTQAASSTELHASVYNNWIDKKTSVVNTVADSEDIRKGTPAIVSSRLADANSSHSSFSGFAVVDRSDGEILASSIAAAEGENIYNFGLNRSTADRTSFVSTGRVRVPGKPERQSLIGTSLFWEDRVLIGMLPSSRGAETASVFPNSTTTIRNPSGELFIGTAKTESLPVPRDVGTDPLVVERPDTFYGYQRIDSTKTAGDITLLVTTRIPKQSAFSFKRQVLEDFAVTLAITFTTLIGSALLVTRSITGRIETVARSARKVSNGNLDTSIESDRADELGVLSSAIEDMRATLKSRLTEVENALQEAQAATEEAETARKTAETAQEEAEALNEHLNEKAREFTLVIEDAATGDFTQRLDPESESEAMERIAVEFNGMIDDIESTIRDVQAFSEEVAAASEAVTTGANELQEASVEVSDSIQAISSGTYDQSQELQSVSDEMNQLSTTIDRIASSAQAVAETSGETASVADTGQRTAQQTIEEMNAVQVTMNASVRNVEELENKVAEVGQITELIGRIAEQTNILALNANIEAAHASGGDASGDSFAVVADEIKQLSEDTQTSAKEIDDLIEEIQSQMTDTVEEIKAAENRVREGTESVEETVDAFESVAENVAETDDGIQEISTATEDQANSTEAVVSMVEEASDISRSTAAEAENVSAAAEEQTASLAQVTSNIESVAEQAKALQSLLAEFEVAADASSTGVDYGDDVASVDDQREQ